MRRLGSGNARRGQYRQRGTVCHSVSLPDISAFATNVRPSNTTPMIR
jgi:hypothetical protein